MASKAGGACLCRVFGNTEYVTVSNSVIDGFLWGVASITGTRRMIIECEAWDRIGSRLVDAVGGCAYVPLDMVYGRRLAFDNQCLIKRSLQSGFSIERGKIHSIGDGGNRVYVSSYRGTVYDFSVFAPGAVFVRVTGETESVDYDE